MQRRQMAASKARLVGQNRRTSFAIFRRRRLRRVRSGRQSPQRVFNSRRSTMSMAHPASSGLRRSGPRSCHHRGAAADSPPSPTLTITPAPATGDPVGAFSAAQRCQGFLDLRDWQTRSITLSSGSPSDQRPGTGESVASPLAQCSRDKKSHDRSVLTNTQSRNGNRQIANVG